MQLKVKKIEREKVTSTSLLSHHKSFDPREEFPLTAWCNYRRSQDNERSRLIERKAVVGEARGTSGDGSRKKRKRLYTVSGAKEGVQAQLRPLTRCSCHERSAIVCTRPDVIVPRTGGLTGEWKARRGRESKWDRSWKKLERTDPVSKPIGMSCVVSLKKLILYLLFLLFPFFSPFHSLTRICIDCNLTMEMARSMIRNIGVQVYARPFTLGEMF